MIILFTFSAIALIIALALFIRPLFQFKEPKPMLEQIEIARAEASIDRALAENPVVFTI